MSNPPHVKNETVEKSGVFVRDLSASVVVFLVALPLCMGIALASGMPPASGLVTGIIGGLIVGFLSGQPLQVSGPAAGLAVIVFELVREHGICALGPLFMYRRVDCDSTVSRGARQVAEA
jgi:MFS superfamily sulfate permease-like transporter